MTAKHPAKFSDSILRVFQEILADLPPGRVLDPMSGSNKLKALDLPGFSLLCSELEWPWCHDAGEYRADVQADATRLPFRAGSVDYLVTSQTYANRMADHHRVQSGHVYRTYTHFLRQSLNDPDYNLKANNTGQLQWGPKYRDLHRKIWSEVIRVLAPGGLLLMNISDHIRAGKVVPVSDWHRRTVTEMGLVERSTHAVETPRSRGLQNDHLRVEYENVFVFEKGA